MSGDPQLSRRRALVGGTFALGIAWAGSLFALVAGFLRNSLRKPDASAMVSAGPASDLPAEGFVRHVFSVERERGWQTETVQRVAWLRRTEDGGTLALRGDCSHMGCQVRWSGEEGAFLCPCHDGSFDADGAQRSGPPETGLIELPSRIVDDEVVVELS